MDLETQSQIETRGGARVKTRVMTPNIQQRWVIIHTKYARQGYYTLHDGYLPPQ